MKSGHIKELLDRRRLSAFAPSARESIEIHAAECSECSEALLAAKFAEAMLRSRAEVGVVGPPPYFETRVLAALRERQERKAPFWSFRRWWQASYGMVGAMLLMAAVFGLLTIFAPADNPQADMSNYSIYSTEADILNQRSTRDVSREQMLEVIYGGRQEQRKR